MPLILSAGAVVIAWCCAFAAGKSPSSEQPPAFPEMDASGARPSGVTRADRAAAAPSPDEGGVAGAIPSWSGIGPFGGDVKDVAFSPLDANLILAAVAPASGGGDLYRSTNAGATWSAVPTLANLAVYDVEFAPDGTVYVATIDSVRKSVNAGVSFTLLNLGIGVNDQVLDVTIDPNNAQTLWIGVADAIGTQPVNVMQSINGGTSWSNRTPPLGGALSCQTIAINPGNSQEIYAGFAGAFGGGQVWVSTNGGLNWTNRSAGLPNTPVNDIVHDGTRALVCGGQLFGGQTFGLFHSNNLGVTWTPLHDGSWPSIVLNDIAVDPNNPSILCTVSATSGLFRSVNGGTSWSFGVGGTGSSSLNAVRFAPGSSTRIGLGANSVGTYLSNDGGATFALSNVGISRVNVRGVAANPLNPAEIAVAFEGQNDGGVYTSTDGGATWTLASVPPTRYSNVAFASNGTLYAISSGPSSVAPEGLYRRNPGNTWTGIGPNQGTLFESDLASIRFGDGDPDLIFAGGSDFGVAGFEATVWRKPAGSSTWTKTYEGVEANEFVMDIEIVAGSANQTMIASYVDFSGSSGGGALRSITGGAGWSPSSAGLPATVQANALSRSAADAQTFFLADRNFSGGALYRSIDGGQSWSSTGFNTAVTDVIGDPNDAQVVYILQSNPTVVSQSTNGGANFSPFNSRLSFSGGVNRLTYVPGLQPRLLLATTVGAFATDLEPGADCPANIVATGSSATSVDIDDLLAVISAWGPCPAPPAACPANIATSGTSATVVDIDDLLAVISAWGPCP